MMNRFEELNLLSNNHFINIKDQVNLGTRLSQISSVGTGFVYILGTCIMILKS